MTAALILCRWTAIQVTARIVLPPHATRLQVLVSVVDPPYQMAAPHYSFVKQAREFFVPTVHAQICNGPTPCGYLKSMATPNPACLSGGNYCPDCINGPCTIYSCFSSTNPHQTCDDSYLNCNDACQDVGACKR